MKQIFLVSVFLLALTTSRGQVNLSAGLAASYPFSGNANDVSGNGLHATVEGGATLTTDRFGNAASAYAFDGVNDFLRVADNGALSTPAFSYSFWFTTDRNNLVQVPVGKRDFGPTNNSEFGINLLSAASGSHIQTFLVSATKPCTLFGNPDEYSSADAAAATYCTNRWYHVVVTFSNGVERVYMDGILKNTATTPFLNRSGCQTELRFGMWWSGDPNWFRGKLDDIRWYNREINAAEAFALYSNPAAPPVQANCLACVTLPQAGITSTSLCSGNTNGSLSFSATAGTAPYSVTITDGTNTFTQLITGSTATIPVTVAGTTTYSLVSVKDATGCERSSGFTNGSTTITVHPTPVLTFNPAAPSICAGDSLQLSVSGGSSYVWNPGTGLSSTTLANPKAAPAATTTYAVTATGAGGCTATSNYTVTVRQRPVVTLSAPTSICAGDSTQLTATGGGTYFWWPATGLNNSAIANPKASPATTTTYQALVTGANGCKDSASVTIGINNRPVINITPYSSICTGDSLQLNASGGGVFLWTPASGLNNNTIAGPKASPAATTTYQVLVTNAAGCKDSARTTVTVATRPIVNIGPDTLLCNGASAALNAATPGAVSYSWSNGASTPTINATTAGTYAVAVQFAACLSSSRDTVMVTTGNLPMVTLGADRTICATESAQLSLQATGAASSVVWNTGSTLPTITVNTPGAYWVRVQNQCGAASDTLLLTVENCADEIYFPSAFTPNQDGRNEGFKALHAPGVIVYDYEMTIYNRWGNRVFRTNYLEAAWGGTIEGERQGINTFVYYASYRRTPDGPIIKKKGTFVQIR
ncbi:MAG: hypothetical protein EOO08_08320 [Chitinophagaceae bacterium]|nr:MAG: hypothetical protein EOO08_08320 [Chitinophagaceae bacterium]